MQSASTARATTNATLTGITYIDSLISGATLMGLSTVTIEGSKITPGMVAALQSGGYTVTSRTWDISSGVVRAGILLYDISW
jgi:hypothetical protein